MKLNPKHYSVHEMLQGRLFRIPDYQRAYAWTRKQREDLFADIDEVKRSNQDHFMATVVCLVREKQDIAADSFQAVDVVDGQQRLTTIIILLKAIELLLDTNEKVESKLKREISELLIKGDDHALILLQTNHDNSFIFSDFIRDGRLPNVEPQTAADRNLFDAARECNDFVRQWKAGASLVELVAILRNRFSILYHELDDESIVYRVFEVLNSRGLDVKWLDKLKSQLMGLIFLHASSGSRQSALKEMHEIWTRVYRIIGLRGELGDEALRFAGTWRSSSRANRVIGQEEAVSTLIASAGTQLKQICDVARWVHDVVAAVSRLNDDNRLRAVTQIAHARFVAIAIVLKGFSPDAEARLLMTWERVTFRIFGLGGADSRHKVGEYVRIGYDILNKKISEKKVNEHLIELGDGYSIKEVIEKIDWTNCYEGWAEEVRYLLFRYDEFLAKEAGEQINTGQWNKIWANDPSRSIEHIQPQKSERSYIHNIGNLTMLPPGMNSSLQAKPPAEKAGAYAQCGLRATVQVSGIIKRKGWSKETVQARTLAIEKFVRKEWAD